MPDMSTRMRRKNASGDWDQVKIASSAEIVSRKSGEETVEQSLQNIETNKVNGPFNIYHDLGAIGLSAGSETIVSIFNAMPNNTLLFLPVGSGYAGSSVYPATNGTFMAVRITQEFGMAFFQQVNVNSIWTGVFYRSVSSGSNNWTGWRNYEPEKLTMDSTPTEDSPNPVTSGGLYDYLQQLATTLMQYSDTADGNISKNLNAEISAIESSLNSHTGNSNIHITTSERKLWNSKQNRLTFDSTPTSRSNNPVTSGGIKTALDQKAAANHNHDGTYVPETDVGANGGVAPLGADGKIESQYLPSYVDDVVEGTLTTFPKPGEASKIYVDTATNKSYRWSGSAYTEIGGGVALGETSSTAYRGDRGKIAYDHSQVTGNPHKLTKTDLGLEKVGNFKAVSTVANQGLTGTEQRNAIANLGILATLAELNFVDGVTSNIQTQIDTKANISHEQDFCGTGDNTYIAYPKDGRYRSKIGEDNTGYLKITLPQSWSTTMITFTVSIYNYDQNIGGFEILIGGYPYATDKRWYNTAACTIANRNCLMKNIPVRFGHDGTKCAIYIGERNSVWKKAHITIKDIAVGTANYEIEKWNSGWGIDFVTELGKITSTITNTSSSHTTGLTENRVLISNTDGELGVSSITSTEIGYLDGVTSNIQTQLDSRLSLVPSKNIPSGSDLNTYTTVGTYMVGSGAISNGITNTAIPDAGYALIVCATYGSASSTRTQFAISSTGIIRFRTFSSNSWSAWGDVFTTANKPKATQVIEDGTHRFVTDSEKTRWNNSIDGIVAYYPAANPKTDGILDTSTDTTMLVGVSSTVNKEVYELFGSSISFVFCLQLFYSTISATTTRSQIIIAGDGRIASRYKVGSSGTWSSWRKYADVDHKHNYGAITGMSANRALVSNASGGIAVSAVTSTEIGYLDGVTSNIQTQLKGKASSTHNHNGTYIRLVSQSSQPTNQSTGDLWMEPI